MDIQQPQSEAMVIFMKILGVLVAVVTFRWVIKIFAGKDGKLDLPEFKKMFGFLFFAGAGAWVIYKEGERVDLDHEVYGPVFLGIIFGSLLTVLHLDHALDKIGRIFELLVQLKAGSGKVTEIESNTLIKKNEKITEQPNPDSPLPT